MPIIFKDIVLSEIGKITRILIRRKVYERFCGLCGESSGAYSFIPLSRNSLGFPLFINK